MADTDHTVLIVEDHDLVSITMRSILSAEQTLRIVRTLTVRTLSEARIQCTALALTDVLLDVELPDGDGIDALPELRVLAPQARFIVVSRHDSAAVVQAAFERGAAAFLTKGLPVDEFRERLLQAINGVPVFPEVDDTSGLTRRELVVLRVLSKLAVDKDGARELEIATDTFRGHVKRIMKKLGVHSRAKAVSKARLRRLIP